MKLAVALTGLSVAVVVVLTFMTVRQELILRITKTRILDDTAEVRRREESIGELKDKTRQMKTALVSVNTKIDEMKMKKAESEKSIGELNKNLETCNAQKAEAEKKKTEKADAVNKLKADHEAEKNKAQGDIKNLKQQILDRDKAICAFADTTKEEARKLCGIPEAPK